MTFYLKITYFRKTNLFNTNILSNHFPKRKYSFLKKAINKLQYSFIKVYLKVFSYFHFRLNDI